jgi:hypothetical protein
MADAHHEGRRLTASSSSPPTPFRADDRSFFVADRPLLANPVNDGEHFDREADKTLVLPGFRSPILDAQPTCARLSP